MMKHNRWMVFGVLIGWSWTFSALALKPGDSVPDISVPSTSGESVNLKLSPGSWRVLFFYPKAFTPGCTAQVCGMRHSYKELVQMGVTVYGVSTDSLKTQREFKEKHNLPYDLLADQDKQLSRAFDAMGMMGFNKRITFIISPEGMVTDMIDSVSVGSHDAEVIQLLKKRTGQPES